MWSFQVIFKDKQFFLQLYNPTNLFSAKENMQIVLPPPLISIKNMVAIVVIFLLDE